MIQKLLPIAATAALLVTLTGCGSSENPCPTIACLDSITLHLQDADGNAITGFSGTVDVADTTFDVNCPGQGTGYDCANGALTLNATPPDSITVDLSSKDDPPLRLVGDVALDKPSEPTGSSCPEKCTHVSKTITLEPTSAQ